MLHMTTDMTQVNRNLNTSTSEIYENVSNILVSQLPGKFKNASGHTEGVPVGLTIIMLTICSWIVLSNGVVFVCLIKSKNVMKSLVNVQLLSLSATDLLVGFCSIPGILTPISNFKLFSKYEACAVALYPYFVSQSATIYHTLLIGIHRLLTIRKKSNISQLNNINLKSVLLQVMLIWIGCLTFIAMSFLVFGQYEENLLLCSSKSIFGSNYTLAMLFNTTLINLPPFLCLNIIYIYLILYLRKKLKTVCINQRMCNTHSEESTQTRLRSNYIPSTDGSLSTSQMVSNVNAVYIFGEEPGCSKDTVEKICINQTKREMSVYKLEAEKDHKPESDEHKHNVLPVPKEILELRSGGNIGTDQKNGLKTQKRVLITFGLILFFLNIFMIPLCFFSILDQLSVEFIPRKLRMVFVLMAMMNSAVNPVVHFCRIKPFQKVLKEKFIKLFRLR